ncbi:MAG: transglutaminaseTgpA domain-containing protein [Proteobacteria bacterium]|nr:transglutaminaseTgpA domain-containing protein [Pseudomonadota bacterium]
MRFALAHKVSTYLMVGCALVGMIAGGGVSPAFALGGFIGFVISWWWEPPLVRFEKWTWMWTGLSIVALAYSVLTAVLTGDFLGVGAQFLVWLVVVKGYNRRAARDWQQLYLLAFLMLVAGSVLNADLTFGLCFLGFVITSTWALTMFHLRREMEDNLLVKHAQDRASERVEVQRILESRRIVNGRFFFGTGLLSFVVFLMSAAAFLALPRVGIGFFLKSRAGMTLAGFADGVKLGGHGVIKNDSTVVMRVEIDSKTGGRQAPYIHWRGVAFDQYIGGQWSRSKLAPTTLVSSSDAVPGQSLWYQHYVQQPPLRPAPEQLDQTWVRQEVWLEPLDADVLFGASEPHAWQYGRTLRPRAEKTPKNDEFRLDHGNTLHYTVWSRLTPPPPEVLRAAHGELPRGYEVYLGPDVNPYWDRAITRRTMDLATQITRGLTNDYDKAVAIQQWLDANLTYTLEQKDPEGQEPIDFFLFDRKMGHCEYFASAFAILARAARIPTRQVNGFLGGEWNEYKGYVAVRAGDAHSWDEVFFPTVGWVTFDPTPAASIDELGRGGDGFRARMARMLDTLRFQWGKWVIDYDLASQISLFKSIGSAIKRAAVWVKGLVVDAKDWARDHAPVAIALGVTVILAIALWRRRRRTRVPGDAHARALARKRGVVAMLFDDASRRLARIGHVRDAATTPREFAAKLHAVGAPGAAPLGELVELYYVAHWRIEQGDPGVSARATALHADLLAALEAHKRRRAA